MTDNNHPITPPPELVQQWLAEFYGPESMPGMAPGEMVLHVASVAARWGADQELEACCEVLARELICDGKHVATDLRAVRRPKPLSLKEQALQALDCLCVNHTKATAHENTIRRALEQLDD